GAERASRAYFGRSASMLTPAQAAFLAGLPQRPSGFNPYRGREAAIARQRVVLARMELAGALTADEAREARQEHLTFSGTRSPFAAPPFGEMVLAAAGDPRPARLETTLDGELQADVNGIIASNRPLLTAHGAANVAVVVLDNHTGEWLAWEGSGNYFDAAHRGTIKGPTAPPPPGSAVQPVYLCARVRGGLQPGQRAA